MFFVGCPEPIDRHHTQPFDDQHMVHIIDPAHSQGEFWIDAFEFPNRPNQKPRGNTSFEEAQKECADVGKRLCTASEWRSACLGSNHYRFGYGERYEANRCHTATSIDSGHSSMLKVEELLYESGQKQHCQSDGVFDLIGNLEEWVLDDWQGREGSLEGGAWYTYTEYADCSGQYSRQPDYRTSLNRPVYSAGFRCCKSRNPISKKEIQRDAIQRQSPTQNADYNPKAEIEIAPNIFMDQYEYPNQIASLPMTNVSWTQANQLCQQHGKRLCSVREWEYGCTGGQNWRYSYGDSYIANICAIQQSQMVASGEFWGCISPLGIQDLTGNVWEWTSTPFNALALKNDPNEELMEIRGGSWFSDERKALCRPNDGYPVVDKNSLFPDLGFRCCRGTANIVSKTGLTGQLSCPENMVAIQDFCIDQYEFPNITGNAPTVDLTFFEAQQTCALYGKHLCLNSEWDLACGGLENRRWPYGDEFQSDICHDGGNDDRPIHQAALLGTHPECKTPENIYDLSGNVWEWTQDDHSSQIGYLRGGGWNLSAGLGQCRVKSQSQAHHHSGETGFRCCANAFESKALQRKHR